MPSTSPTRERARCRSSTGAPSERRPRSRPAPAPTASRSSHPSPPSNDRAGMNVPRRAIAGVPIPDSSLAREATEFVQDVCTQLLFDHSRRVFLWGSLQGEKHGLDYDPELLYVGAMFHDIGLVEGHRSEHERFEIDGANAARAFLERHGLPEERVMTVWESIALHTTPEIPRYKQPEVRLVTLGV